MAELLIVSNKYNDVFTVCDSSEAIEGIERAKAHYKSDLDLVTSHKQNYPKDADYWQSRIDYYSAILAGGFCAIDWEAYKQRQRRLWLDKPVKECTQKEFNDMLNVLPPINWVVNERYSMFFVGECTTMTYYAQYLYDRETKKFYTALADIYDKSTWLNTRLGL